MSTREHVRLERDGFEQHWWMEGDGVPVVLLHRGLADHEATWVRWGSVASFAQLVTPDLRGAGRSVHHGPLSWDLWADDVAAILDDLGHERAVIGGVSAGAGVATRFALRHPERVLAAVLVDPGYHGDRPVSEAQRRGFDRMRDAAARMLTEGTDALAPLYAHLPEDVRTWAMQMAERFDPGSVITTTEFLATEDPPLGSPAALAALTVPTLVVAGSDPYHPADVAQRYLEHLRDGREVPPGGVVDALRALLAEGAEP